MPRQVARVLALVVTPYLRAMVPCHADVVHIREVLLLDARVLALEVTPCLRAMVPCHADVVLIRENVPGDSGGRRGRGALATVLDTKASTSPSKNGPTEVREHAARAGSPRALTQI